MTLKTEVMNDAENLALYHRNNVLQYNHIEKKLFSIVIISLFVLFFLFKKMQS